MQRAPPLIEAALFQLLVFLSIDDPESHRNLLLSLRGMTPPTYI